MAQLRASVQAKPHLAELSCRGARQMQPAGKEVLLLDPDVGSQLPLQLLCMQHDGVGLRFTMQGFGPRVLAHGDIA